MRACVRTCVSACVRAYLLEIVFRNLRFTKGMEGIMLKEALFFFFFSSSSCLRLIYLKDKEMQGNKN